MSLAFSFMMYFYIYSFLLELPFSADETKLKMMQEVSENFEVNKFKKTNPKQQNPTKNPLTF